MTYHMAMSSDTMVMCDNHRRRNGKHNSHLQQTLAITIESAGNVWNDSQ